LIDDRAIIGASEVCSSTSEIDGHPVTTYGFAPLRGDVQPTVLEGRAPRTAHETALATDTFRTLGVEIGDTVRIAGSNATRSFRVVGRVVLPLFKGTSDVQAIADGAAVTGPGVASIYHDDSTTPLVVLRWRPGADVHAAKQRLSARPQQIVPIFGPKIPLEVDRLQQADALPWVLGVFLALIGTLGLAYALVTGVSRRGRDLATLKTLGFRRRQVASTIAVQATLVATAGVLIGVPTGVVIGRLAWERIADQAGMLVVMSIPVLVITGIVLATLLIANLIAAIPARRAAGLQPAVVLRAE
jgi:predicted lysophospholipase L1 biosynthesis ABC-type transport system permease subunit